VTIVVGTRRQEPTASPVAPQSRDDGWSGEVSAALASAAFLSAVFVAFTGLAAGPLRYVDAYAHLAVDPGGWTPLLHVLDRIGQRAVCLPVLAVVLLLVWRRTRSWRPAVLAGGAVFGVNLVVLILKVGLGRSAPATSDPSFFSGGMAYPSGHTANIVLVYGVAAYLVTRYLVPPQRVQAALRGVVGLLCATMVVVSLTLSWHWFGDLVAGLLVGGVVLELAIAVDAVLPTRLPARWLAGLTPRLADILGSAWAGQRGDVRVQPPLVLAQPGERVEQGVLRVPADQHVVGDRDHLHRAEHHGGVAEQQAAVQPALD